MPARTRPGKLPVRPSGVPLSLVRAACLLPLALAFVGGAGWLATTARAQGDQVLTFQMSLGIPNPAGEGGLRGTADGQFVFPKGIAIDSTGRFIVADTESYEGLVVSSNRIQISGRIARWRESLVAPATCQVSSGIQPVWRWTRAIGLS